MTETGRRRVVIASLAVAVVLALGGVVAPPDAVAATAVAVDIAVMWGFFAVAAHGFRRFTRSARGQRTIDVIFGIPGGAVLPVYDPLYDSVKLRHVRKSSL